MADSHRKSERRKKGSRYHDAPVPFPVPIETITRLPASQDLWFNYTGTLQDGIVTVKHSGDLICLYKMGFFGRGLFSRGLPSMYKHMPTMNIPTGGLNTDPYSLRIMRRHMYIRHRAWQKCQRLGRGGTEADSEDEEFDSDGEYDILQLVHPPAQNVAAGVPDSCLPSQQDPALPAHSKLESNSDNTGHVDNMDTGTHQSQPHMETSWEIPAVDLHPWVDDSTTNKQADAWDNMEADVDFWTSDNTKSNVGQHEQSESDGNMECETTLVKPSVGCSHSGDCDNHLNTEHCSNEGPSNCRAAFVSHQTNGEVAEVNKQVTENICDGADDAHSSKFIGNYKQKTVCPSANSLNSSIVNSPKCKHNHICNSSSHTNSHCDNNNTTVLPGSRCKCEENSHLCSIPHADLHGETEDIVSSSETNQSSHCVATDIGCQDTNENGHEHRQMSTMNIIDTDCEHTQQGDEPTRQGDEGTQESGEHTHQGDEHTQQHGEHTQQSGEHTHQGDEHTQQHGEPTQQSGEHTHQGDEHTQQHGEHTQHSGEHTHQGDEHTQQHGEPTQQSGEHTHQGDEHTQHGEHTQQGDEHMQQNGEPTQQNGEPTQRSGEHTQQGEVIHPYCDSEDEDGEYLVIDDSDIEDGPVRRCNKDRYCWKPVTKQNPYPYAEPLLLTLEEAFFLAYGLGCLAVVDSSQKALTLTSLWRTFCTIQRAFVPSYVAYHYLRSRGWVPKPGLLFGVDFVLYKEGPPFYHGSYSVVVRTVREGSLCGVEGLQHRHVTWNSFTGLNRVTEHVAKDLMVCYVIMPKELSEDEMQSPNCISKFKVKLQKSTRWIASQEREKDKPTEDLLPVSP